MPKIPVPCLEPGCPALTQGRRCPRHERAYASRPERQRAQAAYQTLEWRQLRAAVLVRDPICRECGQVPSSTAAHIVARADGGQDTMANLRGLCGPCHSSETAERDGGFGNRKRERRIAR